MSAQGSVDGSLGSMGQAGAFRKTATGWNMSERDSRLHGSWRLVSFELELQESKTRTQPWGADPNGRLIFGADGRMMVLVTAKTRESGSADAQQAALYRAMMAYTGRYRVDADSFIVQVDACWNEAWNGTEQERFYTLDGDALEVFTAWMPNPLAADNAMGRGVLGFVRESSGLCSQ